MRRLIEKAPAKINLTLDVLGLRPDGYHDVEMVMQSVSLYDTVTLTLHGTPGVTLETDRADLPLDRRNLAVDAACRFLEAVGLAKKQGVLIALEKRIPVFAGVGGGSSDAAAVLRGLNRLTRADLRLPELLEIGAEVGSDVPYCILGGTALARGRGEALSPLPPLPGCHIVLCKPGFDVPTPVLFRAIDQWPPRRRPDTKGMISALETGDIHGIAAKLHNVFEAVLEKEQWETVAAIRRMMTEEGALGTAMSGTGPTVFGIFYEEELARRAKFELQSRYREVFLVQPV